MDYFNNNNIVSCLDLFYNRICRICFIIDYFIPRILKRDFGYPKWFSKEMNLYEKKFSNNKSY